MEHNKNKGKILLCSLSTMFGGVELRMAKEAALLLKNGYDCRIAINLHPALEEWARTCRENGIHVYDFDPPPIFEYFHWKNNKSPVVANCMSKLNLEYKVWRLVTFKNRLFARKNGKSIFGKFKPDLMHIFMPWSGFEGTRLWLAHKFDIPVALSIRNAFYDVRPWNPKIAKQYTKIFQSVIGIYAISKGALKCFEDLYGNFVRPDTKITVIHNSVDTDSYTYSETEGPKAKNQLNIPEDALVLGFVGRLEEQKRPLALLDLYIKLKERLPALYLVLVGSGSLEEKLKLVAKKKGIEKTVIFTGWKKDIKTIIPAFDLGISVSKNEGFGTSTVEIMACGIPMIATDVQGTHDILESGKGGILIPLQDDERLFAESLMLLNDKKIRNEMGREARKVVEENFTEKIWNRNIISFYSEIFRLN